MTNENMVRIAWEDKETGETGIGEFLDRESAEEWLGYLDDEYGASTRYWIHADGEVVEA